jgi:diketogulonate reductase-like aldo/keto reductase
MKKAPRLRESLPAIGLGTFMAFDRVPGEPREDLEAVMRQFWDAGGRVIDTSPLYGMGEVNVGDLAARLGIGDRLFITNKIWSTGEYLGDRSHAQRSLDVSLQRLWRKQIDVMMCHSLVNAGTVVPLLQAWRKEGRIRYAGVSHHELAYFPELADWIERGDLDVVQVHYSILAREAERRILPAAAERGMAVMVNMPFEKGRLFKLVQGRALPPFARELGVQSWGQYFLKWIVSHPAITCALPATANPQHAADNMGALHGPLPDQAMRARMLRHMESIPGFDTLSSTPTYPGRTYPGVIERSRQPG